MRRQRPFTSLKIAYSPSRIPENSDLVGKSLTESRLGRTYGLTALSLTRDGQPEIVPGPETQLAVGDRLVVAGDPRNLTIMRDLQNLIINPNPQITLEQLAAGPMALTQAMLSPFTTLAGKTMQELRFRERFGLNVLAIWHGGRAYRSNLAELAVALWEMRYCFTVRVKKSTCWDRNPDFLVLEEAAQVALKLEKAPVAGAIMLGVILVVLVGLAAHRYCRHHRGDAHGHHWLPGYGGSVPFYRVEGGFSHRRDAAAGHCHGAIGHGRFSGRRG